MEIIGISSLVISVDDYYKPRDETPIDEDGSLNFEVLEALRTDLLNQHICELLDGKEVEKPIFDFILGKPKPKGEKIKLGPNSVIIMEGIHCLNDKLTPGVKPSQKFKIFIAPLTQLNIDENNFIANDLNRIIRRIVRDFKTRGHSVISTLERWPSVRKGEIENIFPFMSSADVIFNSALEYEFGVLKVFAKPLLKAIPPTSKYFTQTRALLDFLNNFHALTHDVVPPDSILREFIGGSIFDVISH